MERLRFYVAHNNGLNVMRSTGGALQTDGTFFEGRTLEHLTGCRNHPEIVFAAVAFDGGYRTVDAGKTWQKIMDGDVRTFAIDPRDERIVYMGIGPIRLFRSGDGGTTWEPLDGLLALPAEVQRKWGVPEVLHGRAEPHVRYIFIHPDDSRLLFVLLEHGGVLLSRDGGASWEDRSTGIDYVDMHVIENEPGSTQRYCVSSARGFFRTDDCGAKWYRVENGMPWSGTPVYSYSHEWRIVAGDPPRLVVCGGRGSPGVWAHERVDPKGHILLSDDFGEHWRVATRGLQRENPWMPWALVHHPTEPRTLFCGMGDGARGFLLDPTQRGRGAFYVSRDAGESWDALLAESASVVTAWVAPE